MSIVRKVTLSHKISIDLICAVGESVCDMYGDMKKTLKNMVSL